MQSITILPIQKSFTENSVSNYVRYGSVDECLAKMNSENYCNYEVLGNTIRKLYVDVENIPISDENYIYQLISDLCKYLKIPETYGLTKNSGSTTHKGLSYHIVFPYTLNYPIMEKVMDAFVTVHPQHNDYVDRSVYTNFRLFRLPNNRKENKNGKLFGNDIHVMVKGSVPDMFIQDINGKQELNIQHLIEDIKNMNVEELNKSRRPKASAGRRKNAKILSDVKDMISEIVNKQTEPDGTAESNCYSDATVASLNKHIDNLIEMQKSNIELISTLITTIKQQSEALMAAGQPASELQYKSINASATEAREKAKKELYGLMEQICKEKGLNIEDIFKSMM